MKYLWFPLLMTGITWLEGIIESRTWTVLCSAPKKTAVLKRGIILLAIMLNLAWCHFSMPVSLYYILYYLIRMLNYAGYGEHISKDMFYVNLGYVNYLVLHLSTIGIMALLQHTSMNVLLKDPLWKMISVMVCVSINILETASVLKSKPFSDFLNAEAESEEGRLLMAFLKFCAIYLLLDSLLCYSESEPVYTALFLIGGCVILVSILILYLWYIGKLLQNSRVREENMQLEAKLVLHDRKNGTLRQLTDRDNLTGAYSRRYGIRQLEMYLKSGREVSIVFIDLDHLKIVNDREGHEAGDRYLIGFVTDLIRRLGENSMVSRLGGDEFMILMPGYTLSEAKQRMDDIRTAMENGKQAFFFSFGLSFCPTYREGCVEEMIRDADMSMYQDKRRRR